MNIFSFLKIRSLSEFKSICIALSLILFMYPSFTWQYISIVTPVAFLFLVIGASIQFFIEKNISIKWYFVLYIFYIFYTNIVGTSLSHRIIDTPILVTIVFLLLTRYTIFNVFLIFSKILAVLLAISSLFYCLKIIGVYHPSLIESFGTDGRVYVSYFFNTMLSITQYNLFYKSTGFYRFYAFLNEPGLLGTISALMLCAFKFNFKQNKHLYIYLFAALASMSLASYITIVIGVLPFVKGKRIFHIILVFLIVSIFNFQVLDKFIFSRIEFNDEGKLIGDNRTSRNFDIVWNNFISSSDVFFGKGMGQHKTTVDEEGGVSSWKALVYNFGFFGLILYLSIFVSIFVSIKNKNKYCYMIFLLFILTIYHRPNILYSYYLLIFFGGLLVNSHNFNKKYISVS